MKNNDVRFETDLKPTGRKFSGYAQNEKLEVKGKFSAQIVISDGDRKLKTVSDFYVIPGGHQSLLGRDTAKILGVLQIGLPSQQINTIGSPSDTISSFPYVKGIKLRIPIRISMATSA